MILQKNLNALELTNRPLKDKILNLKEEYFLNIFPSQMPFIPPKEALMMPNIFFCGIGEGLFLKKLINKHIFIFDKAEFFANVLSKIDLSTELSSGKIYLCDVEEKRLEEQLCLLFSQNDCFEYLGLFKLFAYSQFYEKSTMEDFVYQKCISVISRVVGNIDTSFNMETKIHKQFLLNLPLVLKNTPLQRFIYENKGKNKSVIVVCAGPSLNKQLALLKQYQDDFVIFSLDATYKTLLKNAIYPDFVFSMDIYEECAKFYENLPPNLKEPIYVINSSVDQALIQVLKDKKKKIFTLKNMDYQQDFRLNDFGYIDSGVNVAHFAYSFAIALGFLNVIMIGQDLAFNESGNSHADASAFTFHDVEEVEHKAKKLSVLAYGQKDFVQTHIGWDEFRKRLEVLFVSNSQINFYNATEGGAHIEYTTEIPFEIILKKLKQEKKDYILPNGLSDNKQEKACKKILDQIQKENLELTHLSCQAQKLLEILEQNQEMQNYDEIIKSIFNFNAMIDNSYVLKYVMYKPLFYYRGFFNVSLYQDLNNTASAYADFLKIFLEFCKQSLDNTSLAIEKYKILLKL
ncbi:motility associated factor glycosyltransferase family protein [Campylobacter insulaenigrae]|uniref:motility associated factor glycosyltransferase family protein n=1 Tax=Campylobacter insulaenigrae TaxID=260714 RepID=UPI00242E3104|nr:6-hydroxymethylpterin diphosphokinase MptE-like protein [Campylobacter insulaenigrae]